MSIEIITPRFCETDALGHINNVSYAAWLEQGRMGFFIDTKDPFDTPLILAKLEINYRNETFHGTNVEVHSHLARLGTSSFTIAQNIYQNELLVVEAKAVLVQFDFDNKRSIAFNEEQRAHWERFLNSGQRSV
ncbi:MAG: acyl-CoA thioesterase [Cellvibrionaceae bacterium]